MNAGLLPSLKIMPCKTKQSKGNLQSHLKHLHSTVLSNTILLETHELRVTAGFVLMAGFRREAPTGQVMYPADMQGCIVKLLDGSNEGVDTWRALSGNGVGYLPVGDALDDMFYALLVNRLHETSCENS